MISLGFDPQPAGQYPIDRIIVDSDLDGIYCGAMILQVYPSAEVLLSDPNSIDNLLRKGLINKNTLSADLPYRKGIGIYLDHHLSNRPNFEFPGKWQDKDSAAQVVYDYFKDVVDLSKYKSGLEDINKFDLGNLNIDEFLKPSDLIALGIAIIREEKEFNTFLIKLFAKEGIEKGLKNERVQAKIFHMYDARAEFTKFAKKHSKLSENLVVADIREYDGEDITGSYVFNALYPNSDGVIIFKKSLGNTLKVSMYKNPFNKKVKDYDFLAVAKALNPEKSGGHKGACGFIAPEYSTIDGLTVTIKEQLAKQ